MQAPLKICQEFCKVHPCYTHVDKNNSWWSATDDFLIIFQFLITTADWIMIKYFHGAQYHSHCKNVERLAIVLVTCDPGVQTVRQLPSCIISEFTQKECRGKKMTNLVWQTLNYYCLNKFSANVHLPLNRCLWKRPHHSLLLNKGAMFVTHKCFAILIFELSCCISSLL